VASLTAYWTREKFRRSKELQGRELLPAVNPSSNWYRYPAQDHVGGDSKIPSILFYDQEGHVCAVGAEALQDSIIEKAEEEGWAKLEWFFLPI
jgi:hypothetical protein